MDWHWQLSAGFVLGLGFGLFLGVRACTSAVWPKAEGLLIEADDPMEAGWKAFRLASVPVNGASPWLSGVRLHAVRREGAPGRPGVFEVFFEFQPEAVK